MSCLILPLPRPETRSFTGLEIAYLCLSRVKITSIHCYARFFFLKINFMCVGVCLHVWNAPHVCSDLC